MLRRGACPQLDFSLLLSSLLKVAIMLAENNNRFAWETVDNGKKVTSRDQSIIDLSASPSW